MPDGRHGPSQRLLKAKLLNSYLVSMEAQAGAAWLKGYRSASWCQGLVGEFCEADHGPLRRSACLAAFMPCGSSKSRQDALD